DGPGYSKRTLGTADDYVDSDGSGRVLNFKEAQDQARGLLKNGAAPSRATVADGAASYLEWFKDHRKSYSNTEATINAHILPSLGATRIDDLTRKQLRAWLRKLAK